MPSPGGNPVSADTSGVTAGPIQNICALSCVCVGLMKIANGSRVWMSEMLITAVWMSLLMAVS
jgi:hypothetical protein